MCQVQVKEVHVLLANEVDLWPCWFEVKGCSMFDWQ